jgi:hypothetical protein
MRFAGNRSTSHPVSDFPLWNSASSYCSLALAFDVNTVFSLRDEICVDPCLGHRNFLLQLSASSVEAPRRGSWQMDVKVRPLLVDGKIKEFTLGSAHDVTEHLFVVQRMFRLNDSLPQESGPQRWRWEKGGWVLVNRVTGRVEPITMPEFDPYHSQANWFRDYVAYCGTSDDGQKGLAMIVQLGKRRPLLKKALSENNREGCPAPTWQRNPVRVSFATREDPKLTFTVSSLAVDLATDDESEGEE